MKPRSSLSRHLMPALAAMILSAPAFSGEPDTLRLERTVVPVFQSIRLALDPAKNGYQGETEILLDVRSSAHFFRLHSKGLKIRKLTLRSGGRKIPVKWNVKSDDLIRISTKRLLEPGDCSLHIRFARNFQDQGSGLFKGIEEGKPYLATQFEMSYAREAFPCWDEPGFKNPFQVTLIIPSRFSAFSNNPAEKTSIEAGVTTVTFEKTPPLPVYAVAFAVGPFESVPIQGMSIPGNVVVPSGRTRFASDAAAVTAPILRELENRFGPYPFRKLDLLTTPGMFGGAMENPGMVTFAENILLIDPEASTPESRRNCSGIIAHELAHMWFGDLVTTAWWDDTWLNESFATWIGQAVTDTVFPRYNSFAGDIRSAHWAMRSDALPSIRPIRRPLRATDDPWQVFDELSYQKGGAVLGMVESWSGKDNFARGIRGYLAKHAWGNAVAKDLWNSLDTLVEGNVDGIMASFTDQPGVPLISGEIIPGGKLKLSQSRFLNCGFDAPSQLWRVPVVFRYADGVHVREGRHLLERESEIIPLETGTTPAWLNLNADERGYYHWLVSDSMLFRLSGEYPGSLNARERIGFLENASALLDGGRLTGSTYLSILKSFSSDSVPEVLQAVLSGLLKIDGLFVTEDTKDSYSAYMRSVLTPILARIGREKRGGEGETAGMLRSDLISALADQGRDAGMLRFCDSLRTVYMRNPEKVDPELVDAAMGASARHGNQELFDQFLKKYESVQNPEIKSRYLRLLGAFEDRKLLSRALDYSLSGPPGPTDFMMIPFTAAGTKENRAYIFDWAVKNYKRIASKTFPEMVDYLYPGLVQVVSDSLLNKARDFFSDPERKSQSLEINLNKAADRITTAMRVREKEGGSVREFLKQY
jgi:cytosol alanyl aminopeptidase